MQRRTSIIIALVIAVLLVLGTVLSFYWRLWRAIEPPAAKTVGQTCGGIAGLSCPKGFVCEMDENAGIIDNVGVCKPQRQ